MVANIIGTTNQALTPSDTTLGPPSYIAGRKMTFTGNFGATEAETNIQSTAGFPNPIPISAYRQFLLSVIASAWGTANITIRVYPCDSGGNKTTNAFFAIVVSANGTQIVFGAEMGGTTSGATYPPAAQASGVSIGPLGSYLLLTEQGNSFVSGTNTVTLELDLKG